MIIKNALAILDRSVEKKDIRIKGGKIAEISDCINQTDDNDIFDAKENYLFPGFIDIHTHGGCMQRFEDPKCDFQMLFDYLAKNGVTGVCAGISSRPMDVFEKCAQNICSFASDTSPHTKILGIHAEGPFLNPDKKGGMPLEYLAGPQVETLEKMYDVSGGMLKIITLAPEMENAFDVIKRAKELGITVSAGHCNTSYDIMKKAIDAGVTHVTHTFNVCPPLNHRSPGMLGAAFNDDRVCCEVICDFYHVLPPIVQIIRKLKGPDKFVAVSDSVRYAGIETDEPIHEGERTLYFRDGVFFLENGTVCGSGGSMHTAVKNLHSVGIPLWEISKAVSLNPAREICANDICGSIEVGKCADFALLDKELNIKATFADGVRIS